MCSTAVTLGGGIMTTKRLRRAARVGAEEAGVEPALVEVGLDGGRVVLGGERLAHADWRSDPLGESAVVLAVARGWQLMMDVDAGHDPAPPRAAAGALRPGGHPAVEFHRARRRPPAPRG